ncbi:MAG TPA: type III-B CRISPR module-associated protein Cmr5 [Terriglobia bacterium]|nr:type III-B CRISPR module-associated protein Cmr5 [Terriglobia bacterium]
MKESLDQQRARFAWERVQKQRVQIQGDKYAKYVKFAKGAPALIMQSGLMPVLAFMNEKSEKHHEALRDDLCVWLQKRFRTQISVSDFHAVMAALMGKEQGDAAAQAQFYRMATDEALALLRWIRQFAAAVGEKRQGENQHA